MTDIATNITGAAGAPGGLGGAARAPAGLGASAGASGGLRAVPGSTGKAAGGSKNNTGKNGGDPATSIRFHLQLDSLNIGWWNSFEGLGMETAILAVEEGGNNAWVHQLPTRLKYSNVKLARPINEDSGKVAAWFMAISKKVERGANAVISAVDGEKTVIASWSLQNVVPVRWTGPTFNVESAKVATETLEIAYHGFLAPAAKGER